MATVNIINFAHPITDAQLKQIAALCHVDWDRLDQIAVVNIPVQIDMERGMVDEVNRIMDSLPAEFLNEDTRVIVNLPGLAPVAALVAVRIARIRRDWGILILKRDGDTVPPRFVVKEIVWRP